MIPTDIKRPRHVDVPRAAAILYGDWGTSCASRLLLGASRRHALINILRGNVIREVSNLLPEEIDLLVCA